MESLKMQLQKVQQQQIEEDRQKAESRTPTSIPVDARGNESHTREQQEQLCLTACAPSDAHLSELDEDFDEQFGFNGCRHHHYPYSSGSSPVSSSFRMAVHQSRAQSQCGKFNESLLGGLTDSARIKESLCICTSIRPKARADDVQSDSNEGEAAADQRAESDERIFPTKTRSVMDEYKISHEIIGIGESGKVMACYHKRSGEKFALKVLRDSARSRREIELHWLACRQTNVVSIVDIFENTFEGLNCLLVVVEFMQGGDLLTLFEANGRVPYSEQCVARIVRQIGCAVQFLHERNIAHRDIKLENILCTSTNVETCTFKLADFGFAKRSEPDRLMNSPCCTPAYVCPEILSYKEYDKGCDIWALGVATYILLCGYPPFYSMQGLPFSPGMRTRITTGLFAFPAEDWDGVSASTKHMIRLMLRTEPSERITIQQLMSSDFLAVQPAAPTAKSHPPKLPPVPSDSSLSSDAGFESTDSKDGEKQEKEAAAEEEEEDQKEIAAGRAQFFVGGTAKSKSARQWATGAGRPTFRDQRVYSIQEQVDSALAFMRLGAGGGDGFCVLKNPKNGPTGSRLLDRRRSSAASASTETGNEVPN